MKDKCQNGGQWAGMPKGTFFKIPCDDPNCEYCVNRHKLNSEVMHDWLVRHPELNPFQKISEKYRNKHGN